MTSGMMVDPASLHLVGLEELRKRWGWYVALGVLLVILGMVALGASVLTTEVSMLFLGYLMIVTGVVEAAHAFTVKRWGGFFVDLLLGILYAVAGIIIVSRPGVAAVTLTLLIAMLLIFGGVFRIAVAIAVRFPHWGWLLLNGLISLVLGIMIWNSWPESAFWVIGMFVAIDIIFTGWSLVMLGFAAKGMSGGEPAAA